MHDHIISIVLAFYHQSKRISLEAVSRLGGHQVQPDLYNARPPGEAKSIHYNDVTKWRNISMTTVYAAL